MSGGSAQAATEPPETKLADAILLDGVRSAPAPGRSAISTQFRVVRRQPGKTRFAEAARWSAAS